MHNLIENRFDNKIFETYRTQIYIYNVDNHNDLLLFIAFYFYYFLNNI